MNRSRLKDNFIAIIMATVLVLSFAPFGRAAVREAASPDTGINHVHPIDEGDAVFSGYCSYTADIKINTLDRDKWVKRKKLKKKLLKRIREKTRFLVHATHEETEDVTVTDLVEGEDSGFEKVRTKQLTGGYKIIPVEFTVTAVVANGEGVSESYTSSVTTNVILVYAYDDAAGSSGNKRDDKDDAGSAADSGDSGVATGSGSTAGTAKKKDKKKTVASLTEKEDEEETDTAPEIIDNSEEESPVSDVAGVALTVGAAAAAVLFAVLIIPDVMVMRWFRRRKATNKKNRGGML